MSDGLKLCKRCGGTPHKHDVKGIGICVICSGCGAGETKASAGEHIAQNIIAWNENNKYGNDSAFRPCPKCGSTAKPYYGNAAYSCQDCDYFSSTPSRIPECAFENWNRASVKAHGIDPVIKRRHMEDIKVAPDSDYVVTFNGRAVLVSVPLGRQDEWDGIRAMHSVYECLSGSAFYDAEGVRMKCFCTKTGEVTEGVFESEAGYDKERI